MTQSVPTNPDDLVVLGDKRVEISQFDRYRARKGTTDRTALVSTHLLRSFCHFHAQRLFRCLSVKDKKGLCCTQLGEPEQRFGAVLFHYLTDEAGELIDTDKLQGKIKLWPISESRFGDLTTIHKKWPLLDTGFDKPQHDLTGKCSEEQFQRITFNVCPEAHWKKKQAWYDAITTKLPKAVERLKMTLGRQMSEEEVKDLFGTGPRTAPTAAAGDIDISDILQNP